MHIFEKKIIYSGPIFHTGVTFSSPMWLCEIHIYMLPRKFCKIGMCTVVVAAESMIAVATVAEEVAAAVILATVAVAAVAAAVEEWWQQSDSSSSGSDFFAHGGVTWLLL